MMRGHQSLVAMTAWGVGTLQAQKTDWSVHTAYVVFFFLSATLDRGGGGRLHSSQNAPPSMSQTMINLGQPLGLVFPVPDTELDPEEILDGGLDWQWE
eukprot:223414-Pelagomonas_calceolata.AAC.2